MNGLIIFCNEEKDKYSIVREFYEQEQDEWHAKIHKRAGTLEENIQDTLDTCSEYSTMYSLRIEDKTAGFFVKYDDGKGNVALEAFHVKKEFRNACFFKEYWDKIKSMLGTSFVTGIWAKNNAAMGHLLKQGFVLKSKHLIEGKELCIFKI